MLELDIEYSLKPQILVYGDDKKEFRSLEVINAAIPDFALKPVLVLPDFTRFEKDFKAEYSEEEIAGHILSVTKYDAKAGILYLKVCIENPEAITRIEASAQLKRLAEAVQKLENLQATTKDNALTQPKSVARVNWTCEIEEQSGQWACENYDFIQTNLKPIALILKYE